MIPILAFSIRETLWLGDTVWTSRQDSHWCRTLVQSPGEILAYVEVWDWKVEGETESCEVYQGIPVWNLL